MSQATRQETDISKEIELGTKLHIEITTPKKTDRETTTKRVVETRRTITWRNPSKPVFLKMGEYHYYVDKQWLIWETVIKRKPGIRNAYKKYDDAETFDAGYWKLRFDKETCEPLDKQGIAHRSIALSNILRDKWEVEIIEIAQSILPIEITRTLVIVMGVVGIAFAVIGLTLGTFFGPHTVITWLPSAPKVLP